MALTDFLTQIADSIRSKDGTTDVIKATDFPQRILDIPSGGGSSDVILTCGTFTPSSNVNNVEIEHGLSVTPNFSIVFAIVDSAIGTNGAITTSCCVDSDVRFNTRIVGSWGNVSQSSKFGESCDIYSDSTVNFNGDNYSTHKFIAGTTYKWIIGRV